MSDLSFLSKKLQNKYQYTAFLYDILDYPWERMYRKWRSQLLNGVSGNVLEAGVGTGRNLIHYDKSVKLTAIDLSPQMLLIAKQRAKKASCKVNILNVDASTMQGLKDNQFDWMISTFLCCVMPDELQVLAVDQFVRVLKPGGKFKIIEMVYSKKEKTKKIQKKIAPIVEFIYGARFDRKTLDILNAHPQIEVMSTCFLKDDTYLLIEGRKLL